MSKTKPIILAAVGAGVTESVLWFLCFGYACSNRPDMFHNLGLIIHLPGVILAQPLYLKSTLEEPVFVAYIGFLQFFLIFWAAVSVWRQVYGPRKA